VFLDLGQVRMVTGDNKFTAKAIAQECGILTNDEQLVVEGPDFRTWDDARLNRDLEKLVVSYLYCCYVDECLSCLLAVHL
jgi:magnesium-transporting ATPase (P-type)